MSGRNAAPDASVSGLIAWSSQFPKWKYPLGYSRIKSARKAYLDRLGFAAGKAVPISRRTGHQDRLEALRGMGRGKRAFVIGNGPSLRGMDLSALKTDITIASNRFYLARDSVNLTPSYMLFEDTRHIEQSGSAIRDLRGSTKIVALHGAHAVPRPWGDDLLFMNARLIDDPSYWTDWGPLFSEDFAQIVYLGSTVTYIGLQLAYHLGCEEVYLIGVDFSYGAMANDVAPGKMTVTAENIDQVSEAHLIPNYYKIGDTIGVPDYDKQRAAYTKAHSMFEAAGRKVVNLTPGTKLDVFEKGDFAEIISGR